MGSARFNAEFKRDAVRQTMERNYPVARGSQRLSISPHSLYEWRKMFAMSPARSEPHWVCWRAQLLKRWSLRIT